MYARTESASTASTVWLLESSKTRPLFVDPALPPLADKEHIELYRLLTDNLSQQELGNFSGHVEKTQLLVCWTEIEEFKSEELLVLRQGKARQLLAKYVDTASELRLERLSEAQAAVCRAAVQQICDERDGVDSAPASSCFAEVSCGMAVLRATG